MNNNSIQINSYLQNEMSAGERVAFEERLVTDRALREELDIQRQVIQAAVNAGLKISFAKAIRLKKIIQRCIAGSIATAIIITAVLLYYTFNKRSNSIADLKQPVIAAPATDSLQPYINPPLPSINVPISDYSLDAEKGGTIFHPGGSIIYFPPAALIDASGTPVTGIVKVTYREFADPVDFFVSGIPMGYDSAGVKYNFESSGMCEINVYKDNKPVFVNPNAKPQLHLSSTNKSPLHNVYFLDTVARNWKFTGKDIITEVKNTVQTEAQGPTSNYADFIESTGIPVKPVKPAMASEDKQAFSLEIDPGSFEELFAYDHLKFEVVDESTYRRSDADEHWDNVKLERSNTDGIYDITFTNVKRKVTYKVRPVLEGADYDAAMKVFNQKNKAYEEALRKRQTQDQLISDSITAKNKQVLEKINAGREWNDKMNALILERNKKLREQQLRAIEEQQKSQNQLLDKLGKRGTDIRMSTEIIRTFSINNFGIWNCDHPEYPKDEMPILAYYSDAANNPILFQNIAVVYKGFNGITQFPYATQIRVIPNKENMLWSIQDGSFYYFTYNDFMQAGISRERTTFIFRMRKATQQITSYDQIRELIQQL